MTLAAPAQLDLETIQPLLAERTPQQIVEWAVAQFGRDLVMSSSFGAESAVLLHMVTRHLPEVRVIFIDTGYLFAETFAFMERLRLRLNLNVWVYRTRQDPFAYLHKSGEENPTWRKDVDACCAVNKVEPFERAMRELAPAAWIRGIRRSQSQTRRDKRILEWSHRYGCAAVSPLLSWGTRQMHAYLKEHDLPYHPLYEQGYRSVGCNPLSCTRPIQIGEDSRAGRWAGREKLECGINLENSLDSAGL